jgi:DNA-directed RNA polymerase beta' subunit
LIVSPAYTFRKEGSTKIIELDLSPKQKGQLSRKRPDVLMLEKIGELSTNAQEKSVDGDVHMSDGEAAEENEISNGDDSEEDTRETQEVVSAPRAANGRLKTARGRNERVMAAEECRAHLRRLFRHEAEICSLIFGKHGPFAQYSPEGLSLASADAFFMEAIAVTPTRFRPPAKMNDTLYEHSQNELLGKILTTSYRLRDLNVNLRTASDKHNALDEASRKRLLGALLNTLVQLQNDVNSFMDSTKNPTPMRQGQFPPPGVKQTLEKKEGLFRKNMMVRCIMLFFLTGSNNRQTIK